MLLLAKALGQLFVVEVFLYHTWNRLPGAVCIDAQMRAEGRTFNASDLIFLKSELLLRDGKATET